MPETYRDYLARTQPPHDSGQDEPYSGETYQDHIRKHGETEAPSYGALVQSALHETEIARTNKAKLEQLNRELEEARLDPAEQARQRAKQRNREILDRRGVQVSEAIERTQSVADKARQRSYDRLEAARKRAEERETAYWKRKREAQ